MFTGLEIPPAIADALFLMRGGLAGARWIDRENYHVTLRFVGDVDRDTACDFAERLADARPRGAVAVRIDALDVFGGDRPRALIAKVAPSEDLSRLAAEHERIARAAGLPPETRRFVPHVTLARLRGTRAGDVAGLVSARGLLPPLVFTAARAVLYSARDSVGGGPYLVEAAYPFGSHEAETRA